MAICGSAHDPAPPLGFDPIGGPLGRLVFPHVHHVPAKFGEGGVLGPVAVDVAVEFGPPPVSVVTWQRAVLGTAVPEAAVHEHSDLHSREHDVRTTRKAGMVHPEPQAPAVELAAQHDLRFRARAGLATQPRRGRGVQRRRRVIHDTRP